TPQSKRVLFIDAVTPSPSSDAGGYAAFEEIKLFQCLGFDIDFLALHRSTDEADRRSALSDLGVRVLDFDESPLDIVRRSEGVFRYIFITRYHVADIFTDNIRWWSPQSSIILNLADLHFLRESRLAVDDSLLLTLALETKERELGVINRVDLTLSYSQVEIDLLKLEGVDPHKLGLCPWVITPAPAPPPRFTERIGIAFLGGFKHQPNAEAVEWFAKQVLPLLRQRLPGCTLYVYGSHAQQSLHAMQDIQGLVIKGWVEEIAEAYNQSRVFIAPLQSGAGVKGKVIGAFAHGVPCVLSPLAAEGIPVTDGKEVLLASTPEQWVKQIVTLYHNEARWQEVSESAKQLVSTEYSRTNGIARMKKNLGNIK
ncbi:MAG: glycosyltransferase, partial [Halopseudomonas sp.]